MRTARSSAAGCGPGRSARPSSTPRSRRAPPARAARATAPAPEEPDPYRLCFERDLDRVKHSRPWRRLAGKCQVFIAPEDDHLRTRLTHAVEVAQVATGIARAANLCVPLTEAIALAHDCGHGPAGHASEEAFSPYLPEHRLRPRGLRRRRHARRRSTSASRRSTACATTRGAGPPPATPEGEVVAWADRIAYVCHDFEDAVRAGILEPDDLPAEVARRRRHAAGREQIGDVRPRRARRDRPHRPRRHDRAGRHRARRVPRLQLRAHLPPARRRAGRPSRSIRPAPRPRRPLRRRAAPDAADARRRGSRRRRRARPRPPRSRCSYVSGMTDRFALGLGVELLGWRPDDLPRGV